MSNFPQSVSYIRDEGKVLLYLSNYAAKKELEPAATVDTSNLAVKGDFVASKRKVRKLVINELIKFPTGLNDLKTKIDDLEVGKLKTVPIDF